MVYGSLTWLTYTTHDAPADDPNEPSSTFSRKKGIIHPFGWRRKTWDMLVLIILLYNAVVIPYRVRYVVR